MELRTLCWMVFISLCCIPFSTSRSIRPRSESFVLGRLLSVVADASSGGSRTFGPLESGVQYFDLAMLLVHSLWHQDIVDEIEQVQESVDRIEVKLNRLLAASTHFV